MPCLPDLNPTHAASRTVLHDAASRNRPDGGAEPNTGSDPQYSAELAASISTSNAVATTVAGGYPTAREALAAWAEHWGRRAPR